MAQAAHWLDHLSSRLLVKQRLFTAGWGDEDLLERFASSHSFAKVAFPIELKWENIRRLESMEIADATFDSPLLELPSGVQRAHVRRLTPLGPKRGTYVVLAASGEQGYATRTRLFRSLVVEDRIEVLLLENAMYGVRRPKGQRGSSIRTVCEHLLMNFAMVEEGRALVDYCVRLGGGGRVGVCGFSMGGSMAALVAALTPHPIATAILAAGRSAVPVYTEGLLARGVDFQKIGGQDGKERLSQLIAMADLDRHPMPQRPDAAILIGGRRDGYVFAEQVELLAQRWSGSQLRWIDTGHAGAFLLYGAALRQAARDALACLEIKKDWPKSIVQASRC